MSVKVGIAIAIAAGAAILLMRRASAAPSGQLYLPTYEPEPEPEISFGRCASMSSGNRRVWFDPATGDEYSSEDACRAADRNDPLGAPIFGGAP